MNDSRRGSGPQPDPSPKPSSPGTSESQPLNIGETPPLGMSVATIRRLAATPTGLPRADLHVTHGQCSDIGLVRSNNEDATLSFFTTQISAGGRGYFGLFIVADGLGGQRDGEEASATAVRVAAEEINRRIYLPMLGRGDSAVGGSPPTLLEHLSETVRAANQAVMQRVPEGGSTFTLALLLADSLYLAHVGDSRAYLVTHSGGPYSIERLTRDHSVARRLEEIGQITAEEAASHPEKNKLWKILGRDTAQEPDTSTRALPPESYLLLCTDGLWGAVSEEDMLSVILTSGTPQEACDRLVGMANGSGGEDNISAIVLKVEG